MTAYTISIISDTVCPWCYVGKRRLESAIAAHLSKHPADTFATTWHPFYLNPSAPPAGKSIDKQAHYLQKFGPERTAMMHSRLAKIGRQVGIEFAFGGKVGNTRDSHRVIALGGVRGGELLQGKVVDQLFEAYFEKEEDIVDWEVLVRRAVKAGLEEGEVREWLDSGEGGELVDREVKEANARFVSGVPHFTINGQYEIGGAEEPMAFLGVFDEIKEQSGRNVTSNGGETC